MSKWIELNRLTYYKYVGYLVTDNELEATT
nr:MAG TPA: hypothetical protein [Bacteriophage sp.]